MKTAEEYIKERFGVAFIDNYEPITVEIVLNSSFTKWVKQIQEDAYRAGMLDASSIVQKVNNKQNESV